MPDVASPGVSSRRSRSAPLRPPIGGRGGRRRFRLSLRIALSLTTYFVGAWGFEGILAHGLFPHAELVVAAIALATTIPVAMFLLGRAVPFRPGTLARLFFIRTLLYVHFALPLLTVAAGTGVVIGSIMGAPLAGGRTGAVVFFAIMIVAVIAGYVGSRRLELQPLEVPIVGLPRAFDGLTIAQLSDLHVHAHTTARFFRRVREMVARAAPDIIVVTGDLIDGRSEDTAAYVRALGELRAPHGVFMIPGNHDVYAGWDEVKAHLETAQIGEILVNESRLVRRDGATLAIVGTGDPAGGPWTDASSVGPNIDRALSAVPDGVAVIALMHNPALWPALVERGVALTLSGHTHWGQFAIRRLRWSLASPFLGLAMGAYTSGPSTLYINPGTGYWGIPFRIGATSEVTLITLRAAPAQ